MEHPELIPNLFKTEYRKIVSVLCNLFGIEHMEVAEDIVSDTFLLASDLWSIKGPPENPTAWLYTVAKNKTRDYLKRDSLFAQRISKAIKYNADLSEEIEIDWSIKNINDSQLAMIFVVCHPCNTAEAQIGLALNLLCGFSVGEIANAFLTGKTAVYKQLQRAKERLRMERINIEQPSRSEIEARLPAVLMTLYLLFNEGYYSSNEKVTLRENLCLEAMRLTLLLVENQQTNHPFSNALLSLMCFHSSRFDARLTQNGEVILYPEQDTALWNQELIVKGEYYLRQAQLGNTLSKYHLEAGIAYWHTIQADQKEKWKNILKLYDQLLLVEFSPIASLNRTYALAKVQGKRAAILAAERISLPDNHLYHSLLGELHMDLDNDKAVRHFQQALALAKSKTDKLFISGKILACEQKYTG